MSRYLLAAIGPILLFPPFLHAGLMIPDIAHDRIMLFDHVTGDVVDADWITDVGAVGWNFTSPYEAIQVNNEIWVSDQVVGNVLRFDSSTRAYLSSISARPGGGSFFQPNGLSFDGQHVYLTNTGGNTQSTGISKYSSNGAPVAFFSSISSADVAPFNGDLLVTAAGGINRRSSIDGTFINTFATGSFPGQVSVLNDNSVLTLFPFNLAAGVYHYNPDGTLRRYIATAPLSGSRRGTFLLDDGNYLVTTSTGVFKYDIVSATFEEIMGGVNAQNVTFIPEPCALTMLATSLLCLRRSRHHR
jgi:hypothetical protein